MSRFVKYDDIKLNTELEGLSACGIHKGCTGMIAECGTGKYLVLFLSDYNYGDYACAWVDEKYLDYWTHGERELEKEWDGFFATHDVSKKTAFKPQKFHEYDMVELTVEKEEYAKEGVHKGATGAVMVTYAINSKWDVIFSENGTGKDIAEICVHEDDLKLIE